MASATDSQWAEFLREFGRAAWEAGNLSQEQLREITLRLATRDYALTPETLATKFETGLAAESLSTLSNRVTQPPAVSPPHTPRDDGSRATFVSSREEGQSSPQSPSEYALPRTPETWPTPGRGPPLPGFAQDTPSDRRDTCGDFPPKDTTQAAPHRAAQPIPAFVPPTEDDDEGSRVVPSPHDDDYWTEWEWHTGGSRHSFYDNSADQDY
ncbi:hypothetical protein GGS23DRAFT_595844 [Durotheca rogersii]|uniref:uncharacterized protein n=1 Tax=Durotheca rogersii TaxID=419775 RepID=UPI0022204A5B|nr:uncharacterized protein GGS23DRAFT_595844 [Durotheca rogersii]KAI5864207.1 hypothetical protein GGS23DRAFT_595844 [Durotheca rogersii]